MARRRNADPCGGRAGRSGERGALLVLVLVTLLSLTGVVLAVMAFSFEGAGRMGRLAQERQAAFTSEAGLALAQDILKRDDDQDADTLFEPWAMPFKTRDMTISIAPCNARLNLSRLTGAGGDEEAIQRRVLAVEDILARRGVSPGAVDFLLDWTDLDNQDERVEGSESGAYDRREPRVRPRNDNLARPEELLLVRGFESFSPELVRRLFTLWSEDPTKININFASEEAFKVYLPELAQYYQQIDAYRRSTGFTDPTQLRSVLGLSAEEATRYAKYLTARSNYFEILIEQRSPGLATLTRYIVRRSGSQSDSTLIHRDVLWTRPLNNDSSELTSQEELSTAPPSAVGRRSAPGSSGASGAGDAGQGRGGSAAGAKSTFGPTRSSSSGGSSTFGPSSGSTRSAGPPGGGDGT